MQERDPPPVFLIKLPTLRDKIALDACLAIEGARYPNSSEYTAALREGVRDNVVDEEQPDLLAIIEEYEGVLEEGNTIGDELSGKIDQIAKALRPYCRALSQVEGERGRFLALAMLVRAEMFLINIEDTDAPKIEKRSGRLTEQSQDAIEKKYGQGTLFMIGARTVELTSPTEAETKNLESPEPLPPDPEILTVDPEPPMARRGRSSANGTKEIHA
jgi:hypothetical protein